MTNSSLLIKISVDLRNNSGLVKVGDGGGAGNGVDMNSENFQRGTS